MTFNIRFDDGAGDRHAWRNRRDLVRAMIRAHSPDLLALQEPTAGQCQDIAAALPEWSSFGTAEDDSDDRPRGFFRADRFELRERGVFWLSDTPSVPGSISWPNDWGARACVWVRLHDRQAHSELVFASTQFDTNAAAWLPSALVLHAELARIAGDAPVIVSGDFNCSAGSDPHRYLVGTAGYRDAWSDAGNPDEALVTFNGFTNCTRLPEAADALRAWLEATSTPLDVFGHYPEHVRAHRNYRIDWILVTRPLRCTSALIDFRNDRGVPPSDHYPVVAQIEWAA